MAAYDGYIDIHSPVVPSALREVFPQMGDVWDWGEDREPGPIEDRQGLCLDKPLSTSEMEALDAAVASGDIKGYDYCPPFGQ